ncbi:MAG: hypothetical protein WAV01_03105 [Candidatus Saccharimonadales bacterium]
MALIVADRVKETSAAPGTSAFTMAGAMTGFIRFASAPSMAVGATCYYAAQAVDAGGALTGGWEVGLGTYSAADTLTRTTIIASSNAGAAVNFTGTTQVYITQPALQAAWAREKLTSARTYYVRTDGADTNTGLENTAGTAFLTIQKACDVAAGIDAAGYQVTIQLADGTYSAGAVPKPMQGTLPLIITGNLSTPSNVYVNLTGSICFQVDKPSTYVQITNMKLASTTVCLRAFPAGLLEYGNIVFGAASVRHIDSIAQGYVSAIGNYSIVGAAPMHIFAQSGGHIRIVSRTVTLTGTPAFSTAFASSSAGATMDISANTFSGSATGSRYACSLNGVISTAGATLPGDAAGTTATGGQYA